MAYAGSFVTGGRWLRVSWASGNDTGMGQISGLLRKPSVLTDPLTRTIPAISAERLLANYPGARRPSPLLVGLISVGRGAAEMF